jgi:hypothetical protein
MASSGLKYIHATNSGKNGAIGDLEKGNHLLRELKQERTRLKENELKVNQDAEKAFESWTLQKDLRDQVINSHLIIYFN